MLKQSIRRRMFLSRTLLPPLLFLFGIGLTMFFMIAVPTYKAAAATDSTINFQARLLTASGSIVPDGTYNIEFKLYNTLTSSGSSQGSCSGDAACLWTETRTTTNKVAVRGGYLTVNLGSVTGFASTINWDQDLYLTMNIGGTGTASWDGEMNPRIHLTAIPYAFRAGSLASLSTGGFTSTLSFATGIGQNSTITLPDPGSSSATVCYQNAACGFVTGSGTAFLQGGNTFSGTTAGSLGTLNNGNLNFLTNNATRLTLDTSGNLQFQQASTVNIASATTGTQLTVKGGDATSGTNVGGNLVLQGGAGASTGASGSVIVKANINNATSAFVVQNAGGTAVLTTDTTNAQLKVRGINSVATVGVNLATTTCTGTNWALTSGTQAAATALYTHSGSGINGLGCTITGGVTAGQVYQIVFTTTGTNGTETFTPQIGAISGGSTTGNMTAMTEFITANSTAALLFTPNLSTTTAAISSITVSAATLSNSVVAVQNSDATNGLEIRAGGSGLGNSFVGVSAGQSDTTGNFNSALGFQALQSNVIGVDDTGLGYQALQSNADGSDNTAVGYVALKNNITGGTNTAVGSGALGANISGPENTAVGYWALTSNTTGTTNTALGKFALQDNLSGGANTALSAYALQNNSVGSNNTAAGVGSLQNELGGNNVAFGNSTLANNGSGANNTAVGYQAGQGTGNNTVQGGTFVGNFAGVNVATGANFDTYIGDQAGYQDPTVTGYNTLTTATNSTAIGYGSEVQASNSLILGGQGANAVSVGIGTTSPTNTFSVSPDNYDTGTACQGAAAGCAATGTQIFGTGTTWTAAMVGDEVVFANGTKATITARTSNTQMTVSTNVKVSGSSYRFHLPALQVKSNGNVGIGIAAPTANLQINTQTNTATAFLVQNASAVAVTTVDTTNARLVVGSGATGEAAGAVLVLDSDNDATFKAGAAASAPTVVNGAMFYSSTNHSFLCGVAGSWETCNGLLYSNIAEGGAVASCTTACTNLGSAPIPANYCQAGRMIHMIARGVWTTSATTLDFGVYYGTNVAKASDTLIGTETQTSQSVTAIAWSWQLDITIICFDTTHMTIQTQEVLQDDTAAAATTAKVYGSANTGTGTVVTTTGLNNLYVFPTFSASAAGDSATLEQLIVTGN